VVFNASEVAGYKTCQRGCWLETRLGGKTADSMGVREPALKPSRKRGRPQRNMPRFTKQDPGNWPVGIYRGLRETRPWWKLCTHLESQEREVTTTLKLARMISIPKAQCNRN